MRLILRWLINSAAVFALPFIFTSIQVRNLPVALVAGLVIGLLNALVRPILVLLTLPVTIVTLGLFLLVINALLFWLASYVVDGFAVSGFWAAFWGALVYSVITWAVSGLLLGKK